MEAWERVPLDNKSLHFGALDTRVRWRVPVTEATFGGGLGGWLEVGIPGG